MDKIAIRRLQDYLIEAGQTLANAHRMSERISESSEGYSFIAQTNNQIREAQIKIDRAKQELSRLQQSPIDYSMRKRWY